MTSSSFSYYYEEEEEWADDEEEIHRTVHHLVEEIVEECDSIPNSPAPSLPKEIGPKFEVDGSWHRRKTPSTMSSQSAEMEFSSEENEQNEESHFPTIVPKRQPPSYEEVAKRLQRKSLPKMNIEIQKQNQQPNLLASNIPLNIDKSEERESMGKMPSKIKELPKLETMELEMSAVENGQKQPKLGSGRKIGPSELEKNQLKINKNADELKQRPKLSGPRRAFLLFCATFLSLILSSLIVIFVLISFNPNR